MNLPVFQSADQNLMLLQNKWKSILDPVLADPSNNGLILMGQVLASGKNVINHKLGQKLQGWVVIGNNASTTFYDSQASNQQPQLTLILNASGACTVNLLVF